MRTPPNERLSSDIADTPRPRKPGSGKARAQENEPERRCIVTGQSGERAEMVRLALGPDGAVLPDILAKAPGRGAWIGVDRASLSEALANGKLKGGLSRAFKTGSLSIPPELPDLIERGLVKALLDRLGLEKRSGTLILGNDRIDRAAREGAVAWLGHACDAGEDGCKKLDQAWRVGSDMEGSDRRGIRLPLDRDALSVALGRDNVVHLALANDGATERVMQIVSRLLRFQGAKPEDTAKELGGQPA